MTELVKPPPWIHDAPAAEAVFNLLDQYRHQSSLSLAHGNATQSSAHATSEDATATARQLNDLFTTSTAIDSSTTSVQNPSHRFALWRSFLRYFFATLFRSITQISPTSPIQHDLLTLLLEIRTTSNPDDTPPEFYATGGTANFWADLPTWRGVWTDFERRAPLPPRPAPRGEITPSPWPEDDLSAIEWANLNAFLAKLHDQAPDLKFVDVRGMFALIDALEDAHPARVLDALVPTAAWWILEAGATLRGNTVGYPSYRYEDGTRRLPSSHGDLWLGPSGFNDERWIFWRARFVDIARDRELLIETREMASRAAECIVDPGPVNGRDQ